MLKNVAIPLMLAASEAEAQKGPSKDQVRDALAGDLLEQFAGLQADAAACTVAASTADDGIANLAQTYSEKVAAHEAAVNAVNALVAGDWGTANEARKAAVAAAVAQEASSGIAGLLDALDTASEAERAKAALYVAAEKDYAAGLRTQTAANADNILKVAELARLLGLKDASAAQVQAAKDQHAKETLWRKWRYCELGATVVGATLPDAAKGWWQMVQTTYTPAVVASCVVPAVQNAAGSANVREAVTYYTAPGVSPGLPAESEDGTSQWTASVKLTAATTAETAASTFQTHSRSKAGEVAWYTGNLRQKQWAEGARKRQLLYYGSINTARGSAKAVATQMADSASYDQPSPLVAPFLSNDVNTTLMVASAAGANKAMVTSATARDSASTGSVQHVPQGRTQSSSAGEEWKMTWAATTASMKAWNDANTSTPGAVSLWWAKARDLTASVDTWHTKWTADNLELTVSNAGFAESAQQTTGAANAACNVSNAGAGAWVTAHSVNSSANGDADKGACKTACQTASRTALLIDPDTTGPTIDNGGMTMAKWAAASTAWCGGYSYTTGNAANAKCEFNTGDDQAVVNAADTAAAAGDMCARMTTVKAFATIQTDVATKAALVTSGLLTNLVAAADTQAGLEKAWLNAWYVQQYWANLKVQLTETGSTVDVHYGLKSRTYYTLYTNLGLSGTSDDSTVVGAEAATSTAQTSLNNAQEALATLQAATAAAQAVVDGLGSRIIRADLELTELDSLADAGATGTLDAQAAVRLEDWTNYGAVAGPALTASAAKAAADTAVSARTSASATDGGALTEAKALALAAWDQAKLDATGAGTALTNALGGAVLSNLRATVDADTNTWTGQDTALKALVRTAEEADAAMIAAEKARDAAVLACQIAAYDKYRGVLEAAMVKRAEDLKKIKALLETQLAEPAPGTAGARCEKALSNGTYRPARGATTCKEGLCCGAARVWMESGTTADAGWRTVETCQLVTDESYLYQPARAPMATAMPEKVTAAFSCIEGAKKLAAAASAVAAAVYMLA